MLKFKISGQFKPSKGEEEMSSLSTFRFQKKSTTTKFLTSLTLNLHRSLFLFHEFNEAVFLNSFSSQLKKLRETYELLVARREKCDRQKRGFEV